MAARGQRRNVGNLRRCAGIVVQHGWGERRIAGIAQQYRGGGAVDGDGGNPLSQRSGQGSAQPVQGAEPTAPIGKIISALRLRHALALRIDEHGARTAGAEVEAEVEQVRLHCTTLTGASHEYWNCRQMQTNLPVAAASSLFCDVPPRRW